MTKSYKRIAASAAVALVTVVGAATAGPQSETAGRMSAAELTRLNAGLAIKVAGVDRVPLLIEGYRPLFPAPRVVRGQAGKCLVRFSIGVDGRVADAKGDGTDKMMCDHAIIAMRYWRFEPALKNGMPTIASDLAMPVNYELR
ncbi:energy transducer TonB [Lysobacter sp. HA35]